MSEHDNKKLPMVMCRIGLVEMTRHCHLEPYDFAQGRLREGSWFCAYSHVQPGLSISYTKPIIARRSPIYRAIDLYNNRAAPVKGTPVGATQLRSGCHCERSAATSTLRHCERSAAIQSFTGFARFDEKSKMANEQFGFQKPNRLSGLNKMRKEGIN